MVNRTITEWRSLRTSMVQCLGCFRSGSNPWLSACVCGKLTDPQLNDLLRKINVLAHIFLSPMGSCGTSSEDGDSERCVSPSVLRYALRYVCGMELPFTWPCSALGFAFRTTGSQNMFGPSCTWGPSCTCAFGGPVKDSTAFDKCF